MTGKMLAAGSHALVLQRPDDRTPEPRDIIGALGQRAVANDWIPEIRVDVQHRCKIERNANGPELGGQRVRKTLGQPHVATAAEGGHRRPFGKRRLEPRDTPTFLVDTD